MIRIAIIVGSTRPGRKAAVVAEWVHQIASARSDAQYEVIDIADYQLPLLDEPMSPSLGKYMKEHTKRWSAAIASFDGFVFVTPEYNHATSGALKNAIDFLFHEWGNKAAGFVGYGSTGGSRAIENLRLMMGELLVADVRNEVRLSLRDDFENYVQFRRPPAYEPAVNAMLDQVVAWANVLKPLRAA